MKKKYKLYIYIMQSLNIDKLLEVPIPKDFFPRAWDKFLSVPLIFTLVVIFQGCFGGLGVPQTPSRLSNFAKEYPIARVMFVSAIAYTASQDLETAIYSTLIFFVLMHMLRTKEEVKELGSFV
jgi:hypothetical protein